MGLALKKLFGKKEMRILMLGLDAAGKTSEFVMKYSLISLFYFFVCSNFIQTKVRTECHYNPDSRIQRRDSFLEECQI